MDQLDRRIIAALQHNSRESTTNIAAKLGVARTTVHERIKRMEERGVIAGYSVQLHAAEDTPRVQVVVMLEVQQKETNRIIKRLETYPEVKRCLSINGEFDLLLSAEAPPDRGSGYSSRRSGQDPRRPAHQYQRRFWPMDRPKMKPR